MSTSVCVTLENSELARQLDESEAQAITLNKLKTTLSSVQVSTSVCVTLENSELARQLDESG